MTDGEADPLLVRIRLEPSPSEREWLEGIEDGSADPGGSASSEAVSSGEPTRT